MTIIVRKDLLTFVQRVLRTGRLAAERLRSNTPVHFVVDLSHLLDLLIRRVRLRYPARISKPRRIKRPPGSSLEWFADFFFSRKTRDQVLRPTIADMQAEYFEALDAGRRRKAQWVLIRGRGTFLGVVFAHSTRSAFSRLVGVVRGAMS